MHSSRMRTARLLTVSGGSASGGVGGSASQGGLHLRGLPGPRGVCIRGRVCIRQVCPTLGGLHWGSLPNPRAGSASRVVCPTLGVLHPGGSAQPQGWVCILGVCPTLGGLHLGHLPNPRADPLPYVNRMTHRYNNITLPQTSVGAVIMIRGSFNSTSGN